MPSWLRNLSMMLQDKRKTLAWQFWSMHTCSNGHIVDLIEIINIIVIKIQLVRRKTVEECVKDSQCTELPADERVVIS